MERIIIGLEERSIVVLTIMYFLELNTLPQWQGLQRTVDFNIAEKIIAFAVDIHNRKTGSTSDLAFLYT